MTIAGRKTSVSLEEEFWTGLKEVAAVRNMGLFALVSEINAGKHNQVNLSSALRLFVLSFYSAQLEQYRKHHTPP